MLAYPNGRGRGFKNLKVWVRIPEQVHAISPKAEAVVSKATQCQFESDMAYTRLFQQTE
jgi:hypothetical protein